MSSEKFADSGVDVYMILSHPIRRRILTYLDQNHQITFTILSKEWKYATGTIYHHLKLLGELIEQTPNQEYVLTDLGKEVCEWFITSSEGRVKVSQIDAINTLAFPGQQIIDRYWIYLLLVELVLYFSALTEFDKFHLISLGPFLITQNGRSNLIAWNLSLTVIIIVVFVISVIVFSHIRSNFGKVLAVYLIPYGVNSLIVHFVNMIEKVQTITISTDSLVILSIANQFMLLGMVSAILVNDFNLSPERAILVSIIHLYLSLAILILLIL